MRHAEYTAQEVRTHCNVSREWNMYSSMFDKCLEI
jgi:hypothetical protein